MVKGTLKRGWLIFVLGMVAVFALITIVGVLSQKDNPSEQKPVAMKWETPICDLEKARGVFASMKAEGLVERVDQLEKGKAPHVFIKPSWVLLPIEKQRRLAVWIHCYVESVLKRPFIHQKLLPFSHTQPNDREMVALWSWNSGYTLTPRDELQTFGDGLDDNSPDSSPTSIDYETPICPLPEAEKILQVAKTQGLVERIDMHAEKYSVVFIKDAWNLLSREQKRWLNTWLHCWVEHVKEGQEGQWQKRLTYRHVQMNKQVATSGEYGFKMGI